jgi:branched-chain amino acid transport system permease protein
MAQLIQVVVDALSLGSTYALLALGLALVFSIMGLINFAHGELMTIGAYVMVALIVGARLPGWIVIPGTIAATTGAALLMERIAFRPVRGASGATLLLTSFAVSVLLQNLFVVFMGARPKAIPLPAWTNSVLAFGTVTISVLQVLTLVVCLACLVALRLFLTRTSMGVGMRAASQDFVATRLMGIRANHMIAVAFAISGSLAGVATLLYIARRGTVDPYMGLIPVLKAFIAAVLGGLGSLTGAVVGGFLLGTLEVLMQSTLPDDLRPFRDAFVYGLVILVLLARPSGLLGRRATR